MPRLTASSHRHLSRFCRDFTDLRATRVPLTSKGGLPYKPRDLKSAGDPHRWRFSGAKPPFGSALARCGAILRRAPCIRRRSTREADLSTQQAGAQAPSRISRTHGDHGRPQGGRSPARAGPQAAQRLTPNSRITMVRLKQRADFLAAASGAKVATAAFVLQGRNRDDDGPARIGFTVSRKVGTAVERNRVRRRLRDIVERVGGGQSARRATTTCWSDGAPP